MLVIVLLIAPPAARAATVDLSLNLRYTCPSHPEEGGHWILMAKTDDPDGIVGISAYLTNISTEGMAYGTGGIHAGWQYSNPVSGTTLGAVGGSVPSYSDVGGGIINLLYAQNVEPGFVVPGVGSGPGTPGKYGDPLANPAWHNAALIASGTFPGGGDASNQFNRPAFAIAGGNSSGANTLETVGGNSAAPATTSTTVRGDSLHTLNLESPDANLPLLR